VGANADPAIVHLSSEKTVTPEMLEGYGDDSIRDAWKVMGWPVMTILK
jgi:dihydropyrimidinase